MKTRLVKVNLGLALLLSLLANTCWAGNYEDAVLALEPTHYFQLNEILETEPIVDLGSDPIVATHEGDFLDSSEPIDPPLVFDDMLGQIGYPLSPLQTTDPFVNKDGIPFLGFDDDNRGIFNNGAAAVNLGPGRDMADPTMTVAMFFRVPCNPDVPGEECTGGPASQGGERIWSNNFPSSDTGGETFLDDAGHLQVDLGIGANLVVSIDERFSEPLMSNFQVAHGDLVVKDNNWHHLVVSRNGDELENIILVVDGEEITQDRWVDSTDSWGITSPFDAKIGTRTTAPHPHTFNGWTDETAVWLGRQLTVEEAQGLYAAALEGPNDAFLCGDFDLDEDVDAADRTIQTVGWTGALAGGGTATFESGDCDADGDVDTADQTGLIGNWTGALGAGNLEDGDDADLVYDPSNGNVTLSANDTDTGQVISFVIATDQNNMVTANTKFPFFDVGTNTDNTPFQIGQTDPLNQGAGPLVDLGNVLPVGMDLAALSDYLTLAEYASDLGAGGTLDLIVVPEPSAIGLAVLGLLTLTLRQRQG